MKWWRRKRSSAPSPGLDEAERRLREAEERLAETHREGEQVTEVAEQLRALRRRNHFGPMISEALKGSR